MKSKTIVVRCCECHSIQTSSGGWRPGPDIVVDDGETVYSHGYCPICYNSAVAKVANWSGDMTLMFPAEQLTFHSFLGG